MRRITAWFLLLLVMVGALVLRAGLGAETLADGDSVRPFSDDPPYHLMRLESLLAGDVDPSAPDPAVAWPHGATACWPWGFDHLLVSCAHLAGASDATAAARAVSWVPPLLGALLAPLTFLLFAPWAGRRRAIWAALVIALLPAHVGYTLLGRVDHHVVEPLFLVLSLLGPGAVLAGNVRSRAVGVAVCALSGAALGLSFAFYPAALPWAVLGLAVGGIPLALRAPGAAVSFACAAFVGTVVALHSSPWPDTWVFYSPSRVHVAVIAAAASGLVVAAVARTRGVSVLRAIVAGAVASALAVVATTVVAPGFRQALWGGVDYLVAGSFTGLSLEARPLVADPVRTARLVSGLAPLALVGAVVRILGAPCPWGRPGQTGLPPIGADRWLGWAVLGALVLAGTQRRFLVAASPLLAMGLVDGVMILAGIASRGLGSIGVSSRLSAALVAVVVLASAMPAVYYLVDMRPLTPVDRAMYRAADSIRAHAGDSDGKVSRGALVPWGHGHLFQWAAGVGTVCDNFFGVPESDRAMLQCLAMLYEDDPARVASRLAAGYVDYVVLVPPHPEMVRVEAGLLGRTAADYVDEQGRLTPAFARTFQSVAGFWGVQANPGDMGPFGLVLLDRLQEMDSEGDIAAQVLVFEVRH